MKNILDSFIAFLYPPLCIECMQTPERVDHLLCSFCSDLLTLSVTKEKKIASAFEMEGPALSVVRHFRQSGSKKVCEALTSSLVLRWDRLGWPYPDLITYVPSPWFRSFTRGFTPSHLLATEMGRLLQRPVHALLSAKYFPSQMKQSQQARKKLPDDTFSLRGFDIEDRVILLIDDLCQTGTTLQRARAALNEGAPKQLFSLTVCGQIE